MKKLIILLSIVTVFSPLVAFANLSTGLVGYWPMDRRDFIGTSTIVDRSGQGNSGTLVAAPTLVAGKIGQALSFNGSTQYVKLPTSAQVANFSSNNGGIFTESLWFKTTQTTRSDIYSELQGGSGNLLSLNRTTSGKIDFIQQNSGATNCFLFTVGSGLNNGKWHLVTGTTNGSVASVYQDGILSATSTASCTGSLTISSTAIGIKSDLSGNYFNGTVDDVRIYNRALSAGEVKQLYRQGASVHQDSFIGSILNALGL